MNPPFQINFTPLPYQPPSTATESHRVSANSGSNNGSRSNYGNNHGNRVSAPLPTASTCFNLLRLPLYEDEGQLRKQVMTALVYGSEGFSFV